MLLRLSVIALLFTLPSAFAHMGGISGGGGNVLVSYPPVDHGSVSDAVRAIRAAHPLIVRYFEQKEMQYLNGVPVPPILSQLFRQSIVKIASQARPMIRLNKPCLNTDRFPVDGSSNIKTKMVCMSAYTIAAKVDRSAFVAQSAALLAHEFSELAGYSDDQAIQLQTLVLTELSR